jgi:hypothetical protein
MLTFVNASSFYPSMSPDVTNAKTYRCDRGAAEVRRTPAGQPSCTSLISRAFPALWPGGPEISFCHTIDHCEAILNYPKDLGLRRRHCRLFTLPYGPGGLTGPQILTPDGLLV